MIFFVFSRKKLNFGYTFNFKENIHIKKYVKKSYGNFGR